LETCIYAAAAPAVNKVSNTARKKKSKPGIEDSNNDALMPEQEVISIHGPMVRAQVLDLLRRVLLCRNIFVARMRLGMKIICAGSEKRILAGVIVTHTVVSLLVIGMRPRAHRIRSYAGDLGRSGWARGMVVVTRRMRPGR
jgi:hypothetical protein